MIQLTAQQLAGIEKVKDWYTDAVATGFSGPFRWFGPAGTGKTTCAKAIPEYLGLADGGWAGAVYGTFTGKAAHVLRTKGAGPVSTIHSAIYYPTSSAEAKRALADAREALAALDDRRNDLEGSIGLGLLEPINDVADELRELHTKIADLEKKIPELQANARRIRFEFNPECDWAAAGLVILDEVSMVDAKLAADIESLGVPVLVLGDPAQLPPVEGGGYYTNAKPDVLLTEIHRTALDNPITALATRIRTSQGPRLGLTGDDLEPASIRAAMEHEQVICWTNKRRWALINGIRKLKSLPEGQPTAGDKIMCLTNNKDLAVFNGQQFTVRGTTPGTLGPTLELEDDSGNHREIPVFSDGFLGREMQEQAKRSGAGLKGGRMLATFAHCITAHKAQGSEYASVYVVNEMDRLISMESRNKGPAAGVEAARRWMYTAVTRAKDLVTITAPRP